jgi:hypothetical protein
VAGVSLDRELAQRGDQVVAVRADQRDTALQLVGPAAGDLSEHGLFQARRLQMWFRDARRRSLLNHRG